MNDQLNALLFWIYEPLQNQPVSIQATAEALAFIVVTVLLQFLLVNALNVAKMAANKTKNYWDFNAVSAARKPTVLMLWGLSLTTLYLRFEEKFGWESLWLIERGRRVLVLVALAWFVISFIRRAEKSMIADTSIKNLDQTTITAIAKTLRALVSIVCVLLGLQALEYNISSLLAVGGIGGIAISFAAKDLLANFFGGLMIYMDRPFAIGDWVRSPDKNIEGIVEEIGWRRTVIRTFERRPLYVPNAVFTNISVENPSRMSNRRIYETFGLRYADAEVAQVIVEDVKAMISTHPDLETDQIIIVNINQFAESSIDFFVYVYTKTRDWVEYHAVKQQVLMQVHGIIAEHGAEIAFPTRTLDLPEQNLETDHVSPQLPTVD